MKIKCGTDIIEIERIKESIEEMGDKFLERVFTKKEIEYCESKKNQKYQHYAARFAAKEAAFKAISWKLKDKYEISWKDIEVENNNQGRPTLKLTGVDLKEIEDIDISISHCKNYAVAYVTVLSKWDKGDRGKVSHKLYRKMSNFKKSENSTKKWDTFPLSPLSQKGN